METEEFLQRCLLKAKWKFAKSMPQTPHSYTVRDTWRNQMEFVKIVRILQQIGKPERFFSKVFKYYYFNGYKYWTNGYPPNETTIINRCKAELSYD